MSEAVERRNYLYESNAALVSVLSRQLGQAEHPDAKAMLEQAADDLRKAYVDLRVAQDAVLFACMGEQQPERFHFRFDFLRQEVEVTWEEQDAGMTTPNGSRDCSRARG